MQLTSLLTTLFIFICTVLALPLNKRLYRPSSEVFSVIAHHDGGVLQYYLLKWNGEDLLLNGDEKAFFGRVRASQGYVLNLPINGTTLNGTQQAAGTANVHVDPETFKLTTTTNFNNASHDFGIIDSRLSYKNSTEFLACPDASYRGQFYVYWGNHNQTQCPRTGRGYTVELIVQTDAYSNYNPSTNKFDIPSLNSTLSNNLSATKPAAKASGRKRFFFF